MPIDADIVEPFLHSATFERTVKFTLSLESISQGFVWDAETLFIMIVVFTFSVSFAAAIILLFQSVKVLFSIIFLPVIVSIGIPFILPVVATSENAELKSAK